MLPREKFSFLVLSTVSSCALLAFGASCNDSGTKGGSCAPSIATLASIQASGTKATGIAVSDLGIFAGGQLSQNWTVQRSTSGSSWGDVDYQNTIADFGGLGTAPDGTVFGVGAKYTGGSNEPWKVRSTSDGTNWSELDSYNLVANTNARAWGIGFSQVGDIYVVGDASNGTNFRWIVRKSINYGVSWTTVDNFFTGTYSGAQDVAVAPDGAVYVAGKTVVGGKYHWVVRKSLDGATGWTTVDDFQAVAGYDSWANSVAVDSSGTIFVAGLGGGAPATTNALWTVRRSKDGGSTWQTVDTPYRTDDHPGGPYGEAHTIRVNDQGDIWAAGEVTALASYGSTQRLMWTVRRSRDGGDTWSFIEGGVELLPDDGVAFDITLDSSGNAYAAGYFNDHWTVRKYSCY